MIQGWHRLKNKQKCPVCGHTGWCIYHGPQESPDAVLCARVSEGAAKRADGSIIEARNGQGWMHRLRDDPHRIRVPLTSRKEPPKPQPHIAPLAILCRERIQLKHLQELSAALKVSENSLESLKVGWCDGYPDPERGYVPCQAWTFPMRDHKRNVIGIRLRDRNGRKWAVPGSINGLFLPTGFFDGPRLYIVEGASDQAAMIDLRFNSIGRPSNTAGLDYLLGVCAMKQWENICIIKNADPIGSDARRLTDGGANILANSIASTKKPVRIIEPDPPFAKDVREWVACGGTREDIEKHARRARLWRNDS